MIKVNTDDSAVIQNLTHVERAQLKEIRDELKRIDVPQPPIKGTENFQIMFKEFQT
jgi:hypothetical protein